MTPMQIAPARHPYAAAMDKQHAESRHDPVPFRQRFVARLNGPGPCGIKVLTSAFMR